VLNQIEQWIDQTLEDYANKSVSCGQLSPHFTGFYPADFLSRSYFVVVNKIPKPDFPELRQVGLGNFIDMDIDGVTYKNTYFIKPGNENKLSLHFHELVHVLQWQCLGAKSFISRYIQEIQQYGYRDAPLEEMAYSLESYFSNNSEPIDIPDYVQQKI
jgi:hypothetical protein